jgi:hypothetical protein
MVQNPGTAVLLELPAPAQVDTSAASQTTSAAAPATATAAAPVAASPATATAAAATPYKLPAFDAAKGLASVEPALWELADHLALPDDLCEQLAAALALLSSDSGSDLAQQQQQQREQLVRFAADYAQLRMWAGRGRAEWVVKALRQLLQHALAD